MRELVELPLVGSTVDVRSSDALEYWRSIFGGIWGPVELSKVRADELFGSLHSRQIDVLTFNQITFGNQIFECINRDSASLNEPFYSLTFPQSGSAECFVGSARMRLVPNYAYLINVNSSARLRVDEHYSTVNIQIPVSCMENRLGRGVEILSRSIVRPDPIFHLTRQLIDEVTRHSVDLDARTAQFLTHQMLDTIAFFLNGATDSTQESLAMKLVRARALACVDKGYRDAGLTPLIIASQCGISRGYLYKVFADGPSIMTHVRRRRLQAAREMIRAHGKTLTMTSVALACGFSNSSEFSRLFKSEFGVKPSEY